MCNITEIDTNFKVETKIEKEGLKFHSCLAEPFKVYGVFYENGKFRRMPEDIAEKVSDGVHTLSAHTAGGRVRFITDSSYVAIVAQIGAGKMPHFAFAGSAGFDIYVNNEYFSTYVPTVDVTNHVEGIKEFGDKKLREITINFPLYSTVSELYIGLDENAVVKEPTPYVSDKPVVYYGSSITQGGCASRPGSAYQHVITRRFNCDHVNLGFSGSAKGEDAMIEYLAGLDMSLFVCDYDHNAPTYEHLKATHEKLVSAVRRAHPDMPIIIMPKPKYKLPPDDVKRHELIETTYKNAVSKGDKNIYFIDHLALTELCKGEGTVDSCHPTDFGFASMAKAVGDVIEKYKLI